MRRVFLDTNVVLDYFMERGDFYKDSEYIFQAAYNDEVELCLSALSFSNIAYITRKKFSKDELYELLAELRKMETCTKVDDCVVDAAIARKAKDFEDALQYFSAIQAGADCIVTRNIKDFEFAEVLIVTPSDFISKYLKSSFC